MHITAENIYKLILQNGPSSPASLAQETGLGRAMLHRHLKRLHEQGLIEKLGKPPRVVYQGVPSGTEQLQAIAQKISPLDKKVIDKKYAYITATGHLKMGCDGFAAWASKTNQEVNIESLADEYCRLQEDLDKFRSGAVIDASERFANIFADKIIDKTFYSDFYSIPKFGKTKLGYFVLHGKQAQDVRLIKTVSQLIKPHLESIINRHKIEALAWLPHTLPREIPFLKELEKQLQLPLPRISIFKAFSGQIPVAQKSLSKLADRIENAARTFYLDGAVVPFTRVLLIDDAIGSGASMHEVAKKIVAKGQRVSVFSYAVVGSYKGFEVIKEV